MKKLLSIVIAVMMCCAVTVTAFAATPDEAPAYDIKAAIEKAMLESYYLEVKPSHIEIYIVGSTSDDGVYFKYDDGLPRTDVMIETILGEFGYRTAESDKTLLYKDGKIYGIPEAYNSGVIDDDILAELVDFNIGVMRRYYTVELPPVAPATKPVSTSDTATKDTPSNSQNNNGAVQTGQNSVAIFLAVAMLAGCGMIFAKRRTHFE